MLTHLSLFSGIGGIDLGGEWAGFTTVGQVEMADYPTKILEKHWPNVPRWRDVRDVTAESFYERTGRRTIELISGGYPCQPFSTAGKRKGADDDRYLWPEMFRVIQELRPTWVLGENVAGHVSLGLDDTLFDLESAGYTCRTFVIPAAAVGARHRRERVFVVAYSKGKRCGEAWQHRERSEKWVTSSGEILADSNIERLQGRKLSTECGNERIVGKRSMVFHTAIAGLPDWAGGEVGQPRPITEFERSDGREIERDFCGVAHGISRRVDRLKSLGNAVVPQQVYPILAAIAEIERGACEV